MYFLHTLVSQIATATAIGFAWLGYNWITVGAGLHPVVAAVFVVVCVLTPHIPIYQESA